MATKEQMLEEIYDEDFDYFNNAFDMKECIISGGKLIRKWFIKKAYDKWKEKREESHEEAKK